MGWSHEEVAEWSNGQRHSHRREENGHLHPSGNEAFGDFNDPEHQDSGNSTTEQPREVPSGLW